MTDLNENIRDALGLLAHEGYDIYHNGAKLQLNGIGSQWKWVRAAPQPPVSDQEKAEALASFRRFISANAEFDGNLMYIAELLSDFMEHEETVIAALQSKPVPDALTSQTEEAK